MKLSFIPFLFAAVSASNTIRGNDGGDNEEGKRVLYPPEPTGPPPDCYCDPAVVGEFACQHDNDGTCYEKPHYPYPTDDGCYAGTTLCVNQNPIEDSDEPCLVEHTDCTNFGKKGKGPGCCDDMVCEKQTEWWYKCVDPTPPCVQHYGECTHWKKTHHGPDPCCDGFVCTGDNWWASCKPAPSW